MLNRHASRPLGAKRVAENRPSGGRETWRRWVDRFGVHQQLKLEVGEVRLDHLVDTVGRVGDDPAHRAEISLIHQGSPIGGEFLLAGGSFLEGLLPPDLPAGEGSPNITAIRIEDEPVDPICHTLVGAALSKGGLERRTPRATAVLIFAANAPDIDIVAALFGQNLAWRRGVTHGIPALFIWPVLIASVTVLLDRWRRVPGPARARLGPLLAVAAVGVVTHPFLDYLNNYGMRWLMPVRNQWFYGDSLFIVDPWLYLLLGLGLWFGHRNRRSGRADPGGPVRIALAAVSIYVGVMMAGTSLGRAVALRALGGADPGLVMVTAVPVNPFRKQLIAVEDGHYRVGRVDILRRVAQVDSVVSRGPRFADAAAALARTASGRALIRWSRFPVVKALDGGGLRFFDLRYSDGTGPSWAGLDLSPAELVP